MSTYEQRLSSNAWLVGCVAPGDEIRVARRLRKSGVRVRVPCGLVLVRLKGERVRKPRARAFYRGYVFIDRSSVADLEEICLRTEGFWYVVSFGEDYAEIADAALLKAIRYARELSERDDPKQAPAVRLGAIVKVWGGAFGAFGAFAGYVGEVEALKNDMAKLGRYDFKIPTWVPVDRLVVQQTV